MGVIHKIRENFDLAAQVVSERDEEKPRKEDETVSFDPMPLIAWGADVLGRMFKKLGNVLSFRSRRNGQQLTTSSEPINPDDVVAEVEDTFNPVIAAMNESYTSQSGDRRFRLLTFVEDDVCYGGLEVEVVFGHFTDKEEEAFRWFKNEGQGYSDEYQMKWAAVASFIYTATIPVNKCAEGLFYQGQIGERIRSGVAYRKPLEPLPSEYVLGDTYETHDMGMVLRGLFHKFKLGEHTYFDQWTDFETEVRFQMTQQEVRRDNLSVRRDRSEKLES